MSDPFQELRKHHEGCKQRCIVTRCRVGDCSLALPAATSLACECDSCDCFGRTVGEKKPDYVALLAGKHPTHHWFVVEMKSRPRKVGDIAQQLQAGAEVLETDPRFAVTQPVGALVPVLVKARGVKDSDLAALRRELIRYRGKKYPIRVANCGWNLARLLPK